MSKPARLHQRRYESFAAMIAIAFVGAMLAASPETVGGAGPEQGEGTAQQAAHPTAWEYAPYRITIFVEIDASAEWTPKRRFDLTADIERRAHSFVGGLWRLTVREAPAELHWDSAAGISRVSADQLPQAAFDADKVMLLGLTAGRDGQQSIHAREFDVRTRIWGAPWTATTLMVKSRSDSDLADQLVRTLWQSFCPIARIDRISDQGMVVCRIRGGALPPTDHSLEIVQPGTVLRPLIRHFDAQGRTVRDGVFPVHWTWLRVEQCDGATATCRLETGVQDPIELRYDGRTEYLGLAVTARATTSTELIVRARGDNRPLEDVEIFSRGSGGAPPNMVGRTDENGAVTVESPRIEVPMLYLRSGDDLLARLPIVPGVEPKVTVLVEDNGRRLETGDLVSRASDELIDLVAQQALLKTRLQREMVAGRLDAAVATLSTLKTLKTSEAFLKSLDDRRAARPNLAGDPAGAAWLDKRLAEIKPLAANLLNSQDLARLDSLLERKRSR